MAERDLKGLGARIRRHRQQAGLSQADLGEKLGVSYQQVQKYERGANRVSVETLVRLAKALGLPLSSFVDADGGAGKGLSVSEAKPEYAAGLSKEEKDLLKAWRELADDKLRSAFLQTLRAASRKG